MRRALSLALVLTLAAGIFTGCGGSASAASQGGQAAATPEPTVTPEPYEANALTGEAKDADYPEGQRVTAVMVNNITDARPQRGLSDAKMLFEIKVEGGITRFMALFNSHEELPTIGPIRSARDQFFRLVLPWQPIYIHDGESVVQKQYIKNYSYDEWNLNNGGNGYRDFNRKNWRGYSYNNGLVYEHTEYTDAEHVGKYITSNDVDTSRTYNSTFFNFVDYREAPRQVNGDDAAQVTIVHSENYRTRFTYDSSLGQYKMAQYYPQMGDYMDTVDENNERQLAFDNVVVLFTDIHTYPGHEANDLQYAEYSWGGVGYYCYGGHIEKIRWTKGTDLEALQLWNYDMTENLQVNTGKSYVAVVDVDEASRFGYTASESTDGPEAATEETYVESAD